MSEKVRNCSRKCGNGDLNISPSKRSSLHSQNKNRSQKSPVKNRKIIFEVPSKTGTNRKHISTQTTVIEEPDSTSLSFVQRTNKEFKNECNTNDHSHENCQLTWWDVLRLQNAPPKCRQKLENNHECNLNNAKTNYISQNMCMLNKLVNTLHEKVGKTENEEMLYLVSNIRQILGSISKTENEVNSRTSGNVKYENEIKGNHTDSAKYSDNQCNTDSHRESAEQNRQELQNFISAKRKESKVTEDLDDIKNNIALLNVKTDEHKKSFHDFQKFMIYLYNENKNADKIKSERNELEMKLTASVYENKRLKNELKIQQEENVKVANELKNKNDEISAWKDQILKIRHMVSSKSKKKPYSLSKGDFGVSSIYANNMECPVSSSPLDMSLFNESLPVEESKPSFGGAVRNEENDSGIQSNTPNDNKKCTHYSDNKSRPLKNSFHHLLTDLKDHLQFRDADLQLHLASFEDVEPSACLSETTYKCSMPSLNTSQR